MPPKVVPRFRLQQAALKASLPVPSAPVKTEDESSEGYVRLNSFYRPSLEWGTYSVAVTNDIHATTKSGVESFTLKNNSEPQKFFVVIPQFSLPPGTFHSCYPAPGTAVTPNILPHIVFNDPQLPWECMLSDKPDPENLGQTPWLALLVFRQDELVLSPAEMNTLFANVSKKPQPQSSTLSVNLSANDFLLHTRATVPQLFDPKVPGKLDDKVDPQDPVNAIFLKPELFTALFNRYDNLGKAYTPPSKLAYVDRYRELAHVRNVNTLHMADAGAADVGQFSTIISHRTGPINEAVPTDVMVHLVSLEGVQKIGLPLDPKVTRVGLASLYSWSYKCLPESTLTISDALKNIGSQAEKYLRADDQLLSRLAADPAKKLIHDRLSLGYSLVRYRTQMGDETVAFTRGPLVPVKVNQPLIANGWPAQSSSGTDFQILDPSTGIMDITYSTAWQLGRSLAIANPTFRAALTRLRASIHSAAVRSVKSRLAGHAHRDKATVLASLGDTKKTLANMHDQGVPDPRIRSTSKRLVVMPKFSLRDKKTMALYNSSVSDVVKEFAAGKPQGTGQYDQNPAQDKLYNELNVPNNTDWASVFSFILDRLYLSGIPAHYLITDPSYLPEESIRFFYVDPNWVDALIDGTLSLANHLEPDDDTIRCAIKDNINMYLKTPLDQPVGHLPQIPKYGFFLRSQIVKTYPDLKVKAPLPEGDKRTPTPFLQRVANDVLLCMYDREPGDKDFTSITIQQPPHQLSFSVMGLTPDAIQISPRHVWTVKVPPGKDPSFGPITVINMPKPVNPIYDWVNNTMIMENYVPWIKQWLWGQQADHFGNQDEYNPSKPNYHRLASSALVGLQLNDWLWYLTMDALPGTKETSPRQLWTGPPPPTMDDVVDLVEPIASLADLAQIPRAPNLPRIRPNDLSHEKLHTFPLARPFPVDRLLCGTYGNKIENKIQLGVLGSRTLVLSVTFDNENRAPLSECIFEFPLDVPDFQWQYDTAQKRTVPFLASVIHPNTNTGNGVIGGGQAWFDTLLEKTDRKLVLKIVPRAAGQFLKKGMQATVLIRHIVLAGKMGRAVVSPTIVLDTPGAKTVLRGYFEVELV
jgi:hypothetical protein